MALFARPTVFCRFIPVFGLLIHQNEGFIGDFGQVVGNGGDIASFYLRRVETRRYKICRADGTIWYVIF